MHIALVGPIATAQVRHLLAADESALDALHEGYLGAPFLATLIETLLARGHTVSAITTSVGMPLRRDATRWWHGERFHLACCPMRPRAWPFNGWRPGRIVDLYAFERAGLLRAIRASGAELVHAHWAGEFALAALRSGLPHLITCHDLPAQVARLQRGQRQAAYRWLRAGMAWRVMGQARRLTTVSPHMVAQIGPQGRVPVALVPNPLPAWVFKQPAQPEPGRQRVLMVNQGFGPLKNLPPAWRAFAETRVTHPDAELVMLGQDFEPGGLAEAWCKAKLQGAEAMAGLRFIGPVSHREAIAWMARSDVLLHPSLQESFGMVVAEALAVGLPVVAGRASGAVPWVLGEHGRLVDVTQAQALADALGGLLDNPALRRQLGQAGRADMARRFNAAEVARLYEREYVSALRDAAPGRPAPPMDPHR